MQTGQDHSIKPVENTGRLEVMRVPPGTPGAGKGGIIPPHPPWKKGQPSPNPGGRPPAADVGAAILRDLAKNPDADGIGEGARKLAESLLAAAHGERSIDTKAAIEILDRASGPVVREKAISFPQISEGVTLEKRTGPPPPLPVESDVDGPQP